MKEDVLVRIEGIVKENWDRSKTPALLSYIGSILSKEGVNYKEHSSDGRLASLISDNPARFTLKQNPRDKLVSGAIPAGEEYEYPAHEAEIPIESNSAADDAVKKSRGALYSFIRELSKIPRSEANSVIIPTSVLIRLLEGK